MIYSRSAAYAIRALVDLAQVPAGRYTQVKHIAEREQISASFLTRILQDLATDGRFLHSRKGPHGGFVLKRSPAEVRLWDVVEVIDGLSQFTACATSLSECSDEMPCSMHENWTALRDRILGLRTRPKPAACDFDTRPARPARNICPNRRSHRPETLAEISVGRPFSRITPRPSSPATSSS